MKIAGVVVATALALALQTTLARFLVRGTAGIDLAYRRAPAELGVERVRAAKLSRGLFP